MPDWRNPNDYGYAANLDVEGWAWAFLSRNPEYRRDWETMLKAEALWQDSGGGRFNEHAIYDPPRKEGESPKAWYRRTLPGGPPQRPSKYYAARRPIKEMTDPESISQPTFTLTHYPRLSKYEELHADFNFPEDAPEHSYQGGAVMTVSMDLRQPIDGQLREIRSIFQNEKVSSAREISSGSLKPDLDRWTDYLRIIDAKNSNATAREICVAIDPEYAEAHEDFQVDKEISRRWGRIKKMYSRAGIESILNSNL